MDTKMEFKDINGFIRRRKKTFTYAFLLIFLTVGTMAFVLPPVYRSESVILIEEQQIPEHYVKSTITGYLEERLKIITQKVLSQQKLLQIIKKFDLYPEMREQYTSSEVVGELKRHINIKMKYEEVMDKRTGRETELLVGFTLSYDGKVPLKAHEVAAELASLFVQEGLKRRKELASVTTNFFQEQLEKLKEQIGLDEERISQFKQAHLGELPGDETVNLQTIARLERELDRVGMEIRSLHERNILLKGQIANVDPLLPVMTEQGRVAMNPRERLKRLRLDLISLRSTLSKKHPDIKKLEREIRELEVQVGDTDNSVAKIRRVSELKTQLASSKAKLGPKHPEVRRLSRELEMLSREVGKLQTEKALAEVAEGKPDNPVYINLMSQINSTETEISSLMEVKKRISEELDKYQKRLENIPLVERQYNELTRGYESARKKYDEILNKLMTAKLAQGMETKQKGERFTIAVPAQLPEKPYKPNRIAIIIIGFVLALGAGLGLAAVQENMDNSVKTVDQLTNLMGVPVLSVISQVETDEEKQTRRIKSVLIAAGGVCLIIVSLLLINRFYQ